MLFRSEFAQLQFLVAWATVNSTVKGLAGGVPHSLKYAFVPVFPCSQFPCSLKVNGHVPLFPKTLGGPHCLNVTTFVENLQKFWNFIIVLNGSSISSPPENLYLVTIQMIFFSNLTDHVVFGDVFGIFGSRQRISTGQYKISNISVPDLFPCWNFKRKSEWKVKTKSLLLCSCTHYTYKLNFAWLILRCSTYA